MGLRIGASGHPIIGSSKNPAESVAKSTKATTPASLELHIEELVLHGFSHGDRLSIGDAIQQELSRLISEQGLPSVSMGPSSVAHLDAGSFQVAPGAKAQAIGAQLAQHLHPQLAGESNQQSHAGSERKRQ